MTPNLCYVYIFYSTPVTKAKYFPYSWKLRPCWSGALWQIMIPYIDSRWLSQSQSCSFEMYILISWMGRSQSIEMTMCYGLISNARRFYKVLIIWFLLHCTTTTAPAQANFNQILSKAKPCQLWIVVIILTQLWRSCIWVRSNKANSHDQWSPLRNKSSDYSVKLWEIL